MKFLPACFQARLQSFGWQSPKPKPKTKPRRASSRGKKAKTTVDDEFTWPLSSPVPYDLAYAGFIFRPTSTSPDNCYCFECGCQLDGWEADDIPAYEHLTHSPDCGYAIIICLRLRLNDPERVDEDPLGEKMVKARRATFADYWTLDASAGFPTLDQMVEAGWYYDPSEDGPDGVTCPYCSISVEGWEPGDDPLEEHKRRAENANNNCLFFTLKELYHPANIPHIASTAPLPKKAKGKRASAKAGRSSIASDTSVTSSTAAATKFKTTTTRSGRTSIAPNAEPVAPKTKAKTKTTARSKRSSTVSDIEPPAPAPKAKASTARSKRISVASDIEPPAPAPKPKATARSKRVSAASDIEPVAPKAEATTARTKRVSVASDTEPAPAAPKPKTKAKTTTKSKSGSTAIDAATIVQKALPIQADNAANATDIPSDTPKSFKSSKRKSDQIETHEPPRRMSKRLRTSEGDPSSMPESLPTFSLPDALQSTPPHVFRNTPPQLFRNVTPPEARRNATPPKIDRDVHVTPPRSIARPEVTTPEVTTPEDTKMWEPVDVEQFFEDENLPPITDLTSPEKQMTIEGFLLHEAKRQEQILREKMMLQIAALDTQYERALAAIDDL